ncbi:hypothetical protein [Bacillus smithii]|uniref:hypothetical protein n=1 Tax=Bacillus smithii TaxID=1479 RepID=UPI003D263B80
MLESIIQTNCPTFTFIWLLLYSLLFSPHKKTLLHCEQPAFLVGFRQTDTLPAV